MSDYTPRQWEYIHSVEGQCHMSAVRIIGELETELSRARIEAAERLEAIAKLLKEASGTMSYERWPTKFREKVERALY